MTLFAADSPIRVNQVDCSRARRILVRFDAAALARQNLFDGELVTTPFCSPNICWSAWSCTLAGLAAFTRQRLPASEDSPADGSGPICSI